MITCSKCGETQKPSAFYVQGDHLTGKKKICKRCHQGYSRARMRGVKVKTPARTVKSPELLALHRKEAALDRAWTAATQVGKHEKAAKIRERYNEVDAEITLMMKG